jgi:hypothetical protein
MPEKVKALKKELTVNKTDLSSTRRKLESQSDRRMTASTIGVLGAIVSTLPLIFIVIADAITYWQLFIHFIQRSDPTD